MTMADPLEVPDQLVSIGDFGAGKASSVFARAEHAPVFVVKHNVPQYVVMDLQDIDNAPEPDIE